MRSRKLSRDKRRQIIDILLEKRFSEKTKEIREARFELAQTAIDLYLGKNKALFQQCPKEWFGKGSYIRIRLSNGERHRIDLRERQPLPVELVYDWGLIVDDAFAQQLSALNSMDEALHKRRNELRHELRAVLESCSTTKQLLAAWPEIEPVLEQVFPEKSKVPTLPIHNLNREFGLE